MVLQDTTQANVWIESQDVQAFWDIPVFAEHNEVRANRVDARIVNHREKIVSTIEMSCPWVENRGKKDGEKTLNMYRFDGS